MQAPAARQAGLAGVLIGAGIPEDRAKLYERGIRDGGIVIGTRARDDKHAADLERDFNSYGRLERLEVGRDGRSGGWGRSGRSGRSGQVG